MYNLTMLTQKDKKSKQVTHTVYRLSNKFSYKKYNDEKPYEWKLMGHPVCFDRLNVSPFHTDEGHRNAGKNYVLTYVNKS